MDRILPGERVTFEHSMVYILGSSAPGPWPRWRHRVRIAIGAIRALAAESFTADTEADAVAKAEAYVTQCRQHYERYG